MKKITSLILVLAMLVSVMAFSVSALEEYEQNWDIMLAVGDNAVTLSTAAEITVFEFWPEEPGTYLFTVDDPNAQLTYWGSNSFFVWNQSEAPAATLEQVHPEVGPSIMVGVSGVASCTLTITRTGDAVVTPTYENVDYVNKTTPSAFTLEAQELVYVNVIDDQADSAVLGADGYYHLNSENGPVLYANVSGSCPWGAPLSSAAAYGAVKVGVFGEDGQLTEIVNYLPAWEAYVECKDATTGVYPLTEDLVIMFKEIGKDKGWYDADNELGFYLFGENSVDKENGWLFACCYAKEAETEQTIPGDINGDNSVTNEDVVVLLWHTLFPEENPITANGDLNKDNMVTNEDVVLLLWHTLFPEENPL